VQKEEFKLAKEFRGFVLRVLVQEELGGASVALAGLADARRGLVAGQERLVRGVLPELLRRLRQRRPRSAQTFGYHDLSGIYQPGGRNGGRRSSLSPNRMEM